LILSFILFSCDADNCALCSTESADGNYIEIDATVNNSWVYYRFENDGTMVKFAIDSVAFDPTNPENNVFWDIAFQRYHIKTNSGESGIGGAGAYMYPDDYWISSLFNNTTVISNNLEFAADDTVYTFYDIENHAFIDGIANPVLDTYVSIDTLNSYTPIISNNKFIVRSNPHGNIDGTYSEEEYYKFWAYQYNSGVVSVVYERICIDDDCE
jgi:hypothetical protein